MNGKRRILIIGGGFAGTALAIQLMRRTEFPLEIAVVEPREFLGRGVAFGTAYDGHLLNVPAAKMSMYADRPDHFLEWARNTDKNKSGDREIEPGDFLPRKLFGDYVAGELSRAMTETPSGVLLNHVRDEAIDLQSRPEGGALVLLRSGRVLEGEMVVLALGNLPSHYPISKPLPFYDSFRYIHFPWAEGKLEEIPPDEPVLLVGAGLTSIDVALQLRGQNHRALIHALSRRGIQPQNHEPSVPWPLFLDPKNLPGNVRVLLRRVREEIAAARRKGLSWRPVIDALRPVTQALWRGFSVEERKRFLRHLRPFWEVHRHRVAPQVSGEIQAMEYGGQLRRWAGRLVRLVEDGHEVIVRVRLLNSETVVDFRVGWVINCTGPRSDFSKFDHPLLISLLASGLLYHDPLALGFQADGEGALIPYGETEGANWIFTLGAPLKGVLWETTAVPEIRVQTERLAVRILAQMTRKTVS